MSRVLRAILSIGLASAGLVTSATAQEVCEQAPLIADMAEHVIAGRETLPRLMQARFGDTAAFMAIRYGTGNPADSLARVGSADGRPPRMFDDLLDAYMLSLPIGLPQWQTGERAVLDRFTSMLPSTRRALLLADQGETYFTLLSTVMQDEDAARRLSQTDPFGVQVAVSVSDQTVDVRMALAARAEDTGALWTAAALLGDLPDHTAFEAFMLRHADAPDFDNMNPTTMLGISTIGVMNGTAPLNPPRVSSLAARAQSIQRFIVMKAAMAGQPSTFLTIFSNQSGEEQLVALAAQSLLNAINAGQIDPVADPEAAWLHLYEALLENGNASSNQNIMNSFNFPPSAIRSYADFALDSFDVMIAKDALGPYVRGDADAAPDMPVHYSGTLAWADWTAVAAQVRAGALDAIAPQHGMLAVELLWEAGQYRQAFELAQTLMGSSDSIKFARDAMVRLDAGCGRYIGLPGGGLRYGGMAVYKFD